MVPLRFAGTVRLRQQIPLLGHRSKSEITAIGMHAGAGEVMSFRLLT